MSVLNPIHPPHPFRSSAPTATTFAALADAERTAGALAVVVSTVTPAHPTPRHSHEREDETFVVLEGRCVFRIGDQTYDAGTGDLVFAPRGLPHSFRVVGDQARLLTVLTPGGLENFFAVLAARPDLDAQALMGLAADYGVTIHLPPAPFEET
jgi:quercetin dioxygenase-like cupin family protein